MPVRDSHPLEAPGFPWRTNEIVEILVTPHLNILPLRPWDISRSTRRAAINALGHKTKSVGTEQ